MEPPNSSGYVGLVTLSFSRSQPRGHTVFPPVPVTGGSQGCMPLGVTSCSCSHLTAPTWTQEQPVFLWLLLRVSVYLSLPEQHRLWVGFGVTGRPASESSEQLESDIKCSSPSPSPGSHCLPGLLPDQGFPRASSTFPPSLLVPFPPDLKAASPPSSLQCPIPSFLAEHLVCVRHHIWCWRYREGETGKSLPSRLPGCWEDGPEIPETTVQISFWVLVETDALQAKVGDRYPAGKLEGDGEAHFRLCGI